VKDLLGLSIVLHVLKVFAVFRFRVLEEEEVIEHPFNLMLCEGK